MQENVDEIITSKWKDPEFLKKYNRERRRDERGTKRHPNILENGHLWSEENPYGKFKNHREKLDAMAKYRNPIPKIVCPLCGCNYFTTHQEKHILTKKHMNVVELLRKHNVNC